MKGTINFIKYQRGFGFILTEDKEEIFFHISGLFDRRDFENLRENDPVEFEVDSVEGSRKKAINIKKIKNEKEENNKKEDKENFWQKK